jgi:hypothetical protein
VPISFSGFSSGTGTLSIPISWPNSTGVDYLSWAIDGGSSSAASISTSGSNYTTTISQSLGAGAHTLSLVFKKGGASGTQAGNFVESVDIWNGFTSGGWIDGSGTVQSAMSFSSSDFLSSNASLADLVIQDGSTSGSTLSLAFSSATTSYDLYTMPSSDSIVFTPTSSIGGQYITYSWNGGTSTALASGSTSSVLSFNTGVYDNTLTITVRAPDGVTTNAYALTWHSALATVGVSAPTSYLALSLTQSIASPIMQGSSVTFSTSNATLNASGTNWTWSIDGVAQSGQSSSSFTQDTSSMLGTYLIAAGASYEGVAYSGSLTIAVTR